MFTRSQTKKYRILMCLVRLLLEALPFRSRRIELLLSCNSRFSMIPYPCDSRKWRVQMIIGIMSSTPTNSLSVELLVFSFCLVDVEIGKPLPIVKPPPVCPRIFGCTANEASTYHISNPSLLAPNTKGRMLSFLKYSIRCLSFSQSSLSGEPQ
jgi:hypothetical protein